MLFFLSTKIEYEKKTNRLNIHVQNFDQLSKFSSVGIISFTFIIIFTFFIPQIIAESPPSVKVSNTDGRSLNPQLFVKGDNFYIVWMDESPGNLDIFFSKSTDGGITFEEPSNLSDNSGLSAWPRFDVSDNEIYVTWYDYSPCKSDIYFAKYSDNNQSFETINLSTNQGVSYNPWISTSNHNIFVVWNDSSNPDGSLRPAEQRCQEGFDATTHMDIIIARSDDNGSTFQFTNLSNSSFAWNARMLVSGDNVFVVWNQKMIPKSDVFFSMSNNNGISFSEPINVSNSQEESFDAGIQVSGNTVYFVWNESNDETTDIFFSKSNDNGKTFESKINLSNSKTQSQVSRDTQMVVNGDNVYVVWYDSTPGESGVYFVKSIDSGNTFSQPINLSNDRNPIQYAQIAANDQKLAVIWNELMGKNADVFLRSSDDGGETFGSTVNLSQSNTISILSPLGPHITFNDGKFFTIWNEITSDGEGSNLFLNTFNQNLHSAEGNLLLKTTNGAVKVEVDYENVKPEIDEPVKFSLRFLNPTTNQQLENVNYSFSISDVAKNRIYESLNQFSDSGYDTQTVTFSNSGPVTIEIEIFGIGTNDPFDIAYSGQTSAVITVVPEFPIGVIGIMGLVLAASLMIRKFTLFTKPN